MDYFSTDWHLGHKNILKFDNRPFRDIIQHDIAIIKNFMTTVKPGDNFYFLGDFAFANKRMIEGWMETLTSSGANLFFIKGNHDNHDTVDLYKKYGRYLGEQKKIYSYDQEIVLNHYKMAIWDKSHKGSWHLYGHSHGDAENMVIGKSFDVAINIWEYLPVSFDQVKEIMDKREIQKIDHHGQEE